MKLPIYRPIWRARQRLRLVALSLALGGSFSSPLQANDLGTFPSENGRFEAVLRSSDGKGWQLGRTKHLTVQLVAKGATNVAAAPALMGPPAPAILAGPLLVKASMPEHGHGMVLKPVIEQTGPDGFSVAGMKLHMPGVWEIVLETTFGAGEEPARFVIPVTL